MCCLAAEACAGREPFPEPRIATTPSPWGPSVFDGTVTTVDRQKESKQEKYFLKKNYEHKKIMTGFPMYNIVCEYGMFVKLTKSCLDA